MSVMCTPVTLQYKYHQQNHFLPGMEACCLCSILLMSRPCQRKPFLMKRNCVQKWVTKLPTALCSCSLGLPCPALLCFYCRKKWPRNLNVASGVYSQFAISTLPEGHPLWHSVHINQLSNVLFFCGNIWPLCCFAWTAHGFTSEASYLFSPNFRCMHNSIFSLKFLVPLN